VSLALVRVDDRLVHGQVVVGWGRVVSPRRLLVADDEVAANPWERELLSASTEGMEMIAVPVAALPAALEEEDQLGGKAILLFRSPEVAWRAYQAGARFRELQIGGLHFAPGRERVFDYLYLGEADRRALARLVAAGVRVVAQDTPGAPAVEAGEWLSAPRGEA
jgi:mannose/fructose/N-acetylgalactosamine-specific phosphotransferase system component IIB